MTKEGQITISTENIFPIIKKWLYSEKDIFLRELVSNAADAIEKLNKISLLGEAKDIPEAQITVEVDKKQGTISITDTGLGMSADEVEKYINQVAFSGLKDFVEKYQGKDEEHQIIGHFGLGFYSSFMVASKVEIDTLSFQSGAEPVHWSCDGSTQFCLEPSTRKQIGTTVTLHIGDDSKELLGDGTVKTLIHKYSHFLRWPILMDGKVINDTQPLWTRAPSQLKDEDYKQFYAKLFPMNPEPLFWIHLNVDFPFKLRGVLFFPAISQTMDVSQGEIKLYCNQVFVADNCKELIPEFLTLLKGVIDCHDLPLNVSRSYLQTDPQVKKISEHITKKIADKISGLAKTESQQFEKYWSDISPFVKFGMMRDHKFYERMLEHLIFKSSTGGFTSLDAYLERMKEKAENKILFASDESSQAGYIEMYKEHGLEVIITQGFIDKHFLPFLEMQSARKYHFQRVDSELSKHLLQADAGSKIIDPTDKKSVGEKVENLFQKYLGKPKLKLKVEALKSEKVPAMLVMDENLRRIKELQSFGQQDPLQVVGDDDYTLIINHNCPAVKNLVLMEKTFNKEEDIRMVVNQIYDLAYLQQGRFSPDAMQAFINRSVSLLSKLGSAPGISSSGIIV